MNEKLDVVYQQLIKIANRKQHNTDNGLWMVENCDTMLEILHKHKPFEQIRDPENCDVRGFFLWRFFTWPRNYYNDNKLEIIWFVNIYMETNMFVNGGKNMIETFFTPWTMKVRILSKTSLCSQTVSLRVLYCLSTTVIYR